MKLSALPLGRTLVKIRDQIFGLQVSLLTDEEASSPPSPALRADWPDRVYPVENRNLIPQRDCDRFSRSSLNSQIVKI